MRLSYRITIKGIVQGVGFRPFVYNLAAEEDICGIVYNSGPMVVIEAEGRVEKLQRFIKNLREKAPVLSDIHDIDVSAGQLIGYTSFKIVQSISDKNSEIFIPPDVSVCNDCSAELKNSGNRRFKYPFINCTNCGPRFTIIEDIPYDRVKTTMKSFQMCPECAAEYSDPSDRRYHAQPISCPHCGPRLRLSDMSGKPVQGDPIMNTSRLISEGNIIAVKGIGGYHLACNALDPKAVSKLRNRKNRDNKPFAVMAANIDTLREYCHISNDEEKLISGEKKPIVLLKLRGSHKLPEAIAPGNPYLGAMLPYTPLHILLMDSLERFTDLLILTSANISDEPICFTEKDAFERLGGIADHILSHEREIHTRVDDSVTRIFNGREYIIRRARGYVPVPIKIKNCSSSSENPIILSTGGELKNTFCFAVNNNFYLSQHIGDLKNMETLDAFEDGVSHFASMLRIKPQIIAYDMHPDYLSSKYALSSDIPSKVPVQHHHAHMAACMAENGLDGDVIGVIFDGTGYGYDGTIWGGEFLTGGYKNIKRAGHLSYTAMPGGDAAVRQPWRMGLSHIFRAFGWNNLRPRTIHGLGFLKSIYEAAGQDEIDIVMQMLAKRINSPETSSMGRLFDAVSAIIGVCGISAYEGQAAIELEYLYKAGNHKGYGFKVGEGETFAIETDEIIKSISADIASGISKEIIASRFHETAAEIVLKGCERVRTDTGLNRVVLSGGVFQNMVLLGLSMYKLQENGFEVYTHSTVPANDGGIALGQAVIASAAINNGGI